MEERSAQRSAADEAAAAAAAANLQPPPSPPEPPAVPGQRRRRESTGRSLVGPFPFTNFAAARLWKRGITTSPGIYFEHVLRTHPSMFVPVNAENCVFLRLVYPDPAQLDGILAKIQKDNGFCWMLDERKEKWSFSAYEACCLSIMKSDWVLPKARLAVLNHFIEAHEDILMAPGVWKKVVQDLPAYKKLQAKNDMARQAAFDNQLPTYISQAVWEALRSTSLTAPARCWSRMNG